MQPLTIAELQEAIAALETEIPRLINERNAAMECYYETFDVDYLVEAGKALDAILFGKSVLAALRTQLNLTKITPDAVQATGAKLLLRKVAGEYNPTTINSKLPKIQDKHNGSTY